MQYQRRQFITSLTAAAGSVMLPTTTRSQDPTESNRVAGTNRIAGMLMGSLIGDALGGPVEFRDLDQSESQNGLADARKWDAERVLDDSVLKQLSESLVMPSYEILRPDAAAYGPWRANAKAGTITDDSRHKIVVMRALRKMLAGDEDRITSRDLARELIEFTPRLDRPPSAATAELVEEGLREYRYASRWLLGERENAYPVERLWAGVSNCSGQMALLPLAGLFLGDPQLAYRETFEIDFLDAPIARDICSALNAALASALDPKLNMASPQQRWQAMLDGLKTDPFRFRDVPFAGRQLDRWLDLSDSIVQRAKGCPATIYRLLEQEGKPVYYWDAHFTLLVPLTMLKACRFNPLAAMHLTLDFGHDSDSYAQVLGAMAGAVHGTELFPSRMVVAVANRLLADFGESVDHWQVTVAAAAKRWKRRMMR
ncbi:MAG: ADP-ribosylglycohydrolase family protein [Rubripirellula sp.]